MANDDDVNSAQAQLGLMGTANAGNPVGIPTVMSPGQFATMAVQHAQAQQQVLFQQTQTATGGAIGGFARSYSQNMAAINAQQMPNFNGMGMPQPGFNTGMMPNAGMMTNPSMGVYRPFPSNPPPTMPPVPQLPLFPTPFTPSAPAPHFQTPFDYSVAMGQQRNQQLGGAALAVPGAVARGGADYGMGLAGAGIGANLGARAFGARGAAIGGALGMVAGAIGSEVSGFGRGVENFTDSVNPFRVSMLRGQQMMGMSQEFVTGGSQLGMNGRGLNTGGSIAAGRGIENLAHSSQFQKETGGSFSANDLMKITKLAGENGLMESAQSSDAIVSQVRTVAKALRSFMRVAGEPDVAEAIKQMGQFRSMGLDIHDTTQMMQSARMYAKMAGTTVKGMMETGGLQGGMTFQSQGLTAGLGMQVGMHALASAKLSASSGTYTPEQLALLGGTSGIAQRNMESSAAMLKMPLMAASMSTLGAGGTFGLNASNVNALNKGNVNVSGMANMGASNLLAAVNKGGIGAIGMFQAQQTELQDQLGRALGPEGMKRLKMSQVLSTMKELGLSGPGGFATAHQALFHDPQMAMQDMREALNPEFVRNQERQMQVETNQRRYEARENRPGMWDRVARGSSRTGALARELDYRSGRVGAIAGAMLEGASDYMSSSGEDEAAASRGEHITRHNRRLFATTPMESRWAQTETAQERQQYNAKLGAIQAGHREGVDTSQDVDEFLRHAEGGVVGGVSDYARSSSWRNPLGYAAKFTMGLKTVADDATGMRGTAEERLARARDISAGSQKIMRGEGANSQQQSAAIKNIAKQILAADKTGKMTQEQAESQAVIMQVKYGEALVQGANENQSSIPGSGKKPVSESMMRDVASKVSGGVSGIKLEDLNSQMGFFEGAQGGERLREKPVLEGEGKANAIRTDQDMQQVLDQSTAALLGESGVLEQEFIKALAIASGDDPQLATLAALLAAGVPGSVETYLESIPSSERQKTLMAKAGQVSDAMKKRGADYFALLVKAGKKAALNTKTATANFAQAGSTAKSTLNYLNLKAGTERIFRGVKGVDTEAMATQSGTEILQHLTKEQKEGLTGRAQRISEKFDSATTEEGKAAAAKEFDALRGTGASGAKTTSGENLGAEGDLDKQRDDLADMAQQLGEAFPAAVKTFADSSTAMKEAAETIKGSNFGAYVEGALGNSLVDFAKKHM